MKISSRNTLIAAFLLFLSACGGPEIILHDTIKPPMQFDHVARIGVLVWPLDSPDNVLFRKTLVRNIETIGKTAAVPIEIPQNFVDNPLSVDQLSHLSQSNILILIHILSHTVKDTVIPNTGTCPKPPCQVLSMPMTVRTNTITFHVAVVRAFPYHIYLNKTISAANETRKIPLSLWKRNFEPLNTMNLKLYGQISQHIAYLFYPVQIRLKRPFYPFDTKSQKALESLQKSKTRLALFFLNADYSEYLKQNETIPYKLYFNLGVVYESMGIYSLSDYYYKKGLAIKNKKAFVRLEKQVRSFLVYFIGINFFEEGS